MGSTPTVSAGLTARDAQVLAQLQRSERSAVRLARDRELFRGLRRAELHKTLFRLTRGGWIERLERGSYVVLGPGGTRTHSGLAVVADWLEGERYAVTGFAALAHWGLTQHSPSVIEVLLEQPKNDVEYGPVRVHFIRSSSERVERAEAVRVTGARAELRIVGPERALLDAATGRNAIPFYDLTEAIQRATRQRRFSHRKLVREARASTQAAARRLGWLAEHLRLADVSEELHGLVDDGGYVPLDPHAPVNEGRRNPTWRIYENAEVAV